jgi:nucleoid-associated protein YgaU
VGLLERLFGWTQTKDMPMVSDPTDAPILDQPIRRSETDDRTYEVRPGDTLESIARSVYGDARAWQRILEENQGRLGEPPVLYPGMILRLP